MYKLVPKYINPITNKSEGNELVIRLFDTAYIPFVEDNKDYQEYLKWLEEGNTPLPPDTPETSA